ncbi:cytochrome P450 [Streptomyces hirsutus]
MTPPPASDVDLFADDVLVDPYPVYAELRELGPVVHLRKNALRAARYASSVALAAGVVLLASIAFNPMANEALTGTSLRPPAGAHQIVPRCEKTPGPGLKGQIEAKADALVAELVEKGSFEAIDALARAFPLEVVADLIGFEGHVRDNMLRWGQAAMQVLGPMNQRTAENFPIAGELYAWCSQVKATDLAEGSVGRGIFDAEARGTIPPDTAGHIIHQYLGAGVDTTMAAIGNVVALFGSHPDQLDLIREDPSRVPAAFNEVLRFWAPIHAWGRRVTKDVDIDGTVVPAGAQVAILLGAGNRDPRHYENPDAFLVERNPVDHLSFGYGPHGCAGQGLARLEAHAVIEALSRRVKRLVVGAEVRVPSNTTRSIEELPVLEVIPA